MIVQLIRTKPQPGKKEVFGVITLPFQEGNRPLKTLENADFIIPPGTYPFRRTWSPKFKKLLPIIEDVPGREGIRVHSGSKPEHSKGCVLLSFEDMQIIQVFFNRLQIEYEDEELYIQIIERPGLAGSLA